MTVLGPYHPVHGHRETQARAATHQVGNGDGTADGRQLRWYKDLVRETNSAEHYRYQRQLQR